LHKAAKDVFEHQALIQLCQWHKRENVVSYLPKEMKREMRHRLQSADWLELYKPYIQDGKTIVASPHKVYGPETNDLVLQLRKRGIDNCFKKT